VGLLDRWDERNQAKLEGANQRHDPLDDGALASSPAEEAGFVIGSFGVVGLVTGLLLVVAGAWRRLARPRD
jgi:hypothetical protein